jgi:PKD repeat protein
MKKLLLAFITLPIAFAVSGQQKFAAKAESKVNYANQAAIFKSYHIFDLHLDNLSNSISHTNNDNVDFTLALPQLGTFSLQLKAINIFSEDYFATENESKLRMYSKYTTKCISYRGYVKGIVDSKVALTIDDDFFYGSIAINGETYYFEPMDYYDKQSGKGKTIAYNTKDILSTNEKKCGVQEISTRSQTLRQTTAGLGCFIVELAIASDFSMFTRYGTTAAITQHNVGVMNNVQINYLNNSFNDNVEFKIVTQHFSTTSTATDQLLPNYTGTNSNIILQNFAAWAAAGGFGVAHDLGQFWTERNIDGDGAGGFAGTIGLAYVGAVCDNNFKYHILEDWNGVNNNGSGFELCVMTSHEIGHNFDLDHDASGAPFIMAPSVNNTSVWSALSITDFNNYVSGLSAACKNTCAVGLPKPDFRMNSQVLCAGSTLSITDYSFGGPTSWAWTFPSGTPATSTNRNPTVVFSTPGVKRIGLTVSNAFGSKDTFKYVYVDTFPIATPASGCTPTGTVSTDAGIKRFSIENINNATTSPVNQGNVLYNDYSCGNIVSLNTNTTYSGSIQVGTTSPSNVFNWFRGFIDYNNDGNLANDGGPHFTSGASGWIGEIEFSLTTPASIPLASYNRQLRMRVIANSTASNAACPTTANIGNGEVEDYAVSFPIILPDNTIELIGQLSIEGFAKLNWTIASAGFATTYLEKSEDGITFFRIFDKDINNQSFFHFIDPTKINATVFYRAMAKKGDGSLGYSNIIKLTTTPKNILVQNVLPNPFSNKILVQINSSNTQQAIVKLYDTYGRLVKTQNSSLRSGTQTIEIKDLKNLAAAHYILSISTNQGNWCGKVVKN